MTTDAQRRATNKYRRENRKQINIAFYPAEKELYDWCHEIGASGIKKLLQEIKNGN